MISHLGKILAARRVGLPIGRLEFHSLLQVDHGLVPLTGGEIQFAALAPSRGVRFVGLNRYGKIADSLFAMAQFRVLQPSLQRRLRGFLVGLGVRAASRSERYRQNEGQHDPRPQALDFVHGSLN